MNERLQLGQIITVRGTHPDGAPRWAFAGAVVVDDGDALTLQLREGELVDGPEPWAWQADGLLYLWRNKPYSVLATTRARRFPYWYATVHTPVRLEDGELRVTDLDLDLQLFADGRYHVGGAGPDPAQYPALAATGREALAELTELVMAKAFPFNGRGMPQGNKKRDDGQTDNS